MKTGSQEVAGKCHRHISNLLLWTLSAALLCCLPGIAHSAAGNAETIRLGMSTALSGPAADLGSAMRAGVQAAIDEANRSGGIRGRMLELIALDDGYEPTRTAPQMRQLIGEHNVVAVVGNVGTPTAVAAIPIANETKTPFYGAFTGAGVLRRSPPDRYVINFRASYAEETATMVDALLGPCGLKPEEIAFFTQRDSYGDAGYAGGISALKKRGLKDENTVAHVRYERNTLAVEKALADLLALPSTPKAVIMVGAYAPCAQFIKQARENDLGAIFLNVSFVGPTSLAKALGDVGEGVIVTQVVPHFDSNLPAVREYRAALKASDPSAALSFGSLEGYLATRLLRQGMEQIPGVPDRENIVEALEGLGTIDLGLGEPLKLGREDHQASHRVWATILRGGRFVEFKWEELAHK